MKTQIIGLVRFSYIAKNGFRNTFDSLEDTRAFLFEPGRMAFRLRMLEEICIRSMRNQTDQNFQLIILVSLSLPTAYLNRVKEITAPLKGAVVIAEPPKWMVQVTQSSFKKLVEPDTDYVINFRLDDDDALAVDYIANLRETAQKLVAGGLADEPTVIAHSKGIYWDIAKGEDGLRPKTEVKPLGLACAMITKSDMPVSVFRWNHRDMGGYFPLLTLPGDIMFIRSLHAFGDSETVVPKWETQSEPVEMADILQKRFCLNIKDLTIGWQEMLG